VEHFPFFEIAGESYDVGRRHGEILQESIRTQLEEALAAPPQQSGSSRQQALAWAGEQLPRIQALGGSPWMEELRGLADGARIALEEAAALQVRPGTGFMPEGCTSLGVSDDASATGEPLGAQNRDLVPAYRPRMCLLLLRPRGRPAVLMHSVPGELGGVGINESGVAVFANSLWPRTGRNWQAPPLTRRAILECPTADAAAERVKAMDGPAVGSFLIVDAAGRIRNLEVLPQAVAVIARDRGIFVHANHCVDPTLCPFETERSPSPGSPGRSSRLQELLGDVAGRITVQDIKRMLADHSSRPEPLCRHAADPSMWETTAALIAEPATRTLHLSYGPPCEGAFASHRIT